MLRPGQQNKPYPPGSFDFLAAYVVTENAWYILPEETTWDKDCVALYPKSPKAKYEKYREAWHLLGAGPVPGRVDSIRACAEEVAESAECESINIGEGGFG